MHRTIIFWCFILGVFHLSGLGLNPGALTVPLTYVYILLKATTKGNEKGTEFFALSGELSQEIKGAPEYIIVFTSKEVISDKINVRNKARDTWFNTNTENNMPKTIYKYLWKLWKELKDDEFKEFYNGMWIKGIYFVEVDHEDFDDCFYKIGVLMNSIRSKEVWVNMIGGTNQINIAMLVAGGLFAVPARYYYIFQYETGWLNPEINKPSMKKPEPEIIERLLDNWREIPIFHIDIGDIIKKLDELFQEREQPINIGELREKLGGYEDILPKIRGRLVYIVGDKVFKGRLLGEVLNMKRKIEEEGINDFSSWKKWVSERKILWEMNENGRVRKVS